MQAARMCDAEHTGPARNISGASRGFLYRQPVPRGMGTKPNQPLHGASSEHDTLQLCTWTTRCNALRACQRQVQSATHARCNPKVAHNTPRRLRNAQRATRNAQHAARNMQHETRNERYATRKLGARSQMPHTHRHAHAQARALEVARASARTRTRAHGAPLDRSKPMTVAHGPPAQASASSLCMCAAPYGGPP